jgi:cytidine deaminase
MPKVHYQFEYDIFEEVSLLPPHHRQLVEDSRKAAHTAYAAYSGFKVGAAARLQNGVILTGTNQENASYPVGICAERALLAMAGTLHPDIPIEVLAVSYLNTRHPDSSNHPISPCGMCRQAIQEYEDRTKSSMRLLLSGQSGQIYSFARAGFLLPFAFSGAEFKNK